MNKKTVIYILLTLIISTLVSVGLTKYFNINVPPVLVGIAIFATSCLISDNK